MLPQLWMNENSKRKEEPHGSSFDQFMSSLQALDPSVKRYVQTKITVPVP
jgi:hypothetical protein